MKYHSFKYLAIVALSLKVAASLRAASNTTQIQYLSGTDKDHTVPWNFMVTSGRNSGIATNIAVPSCWETQGFGTYNYGNNGAVQNSETGIYNYTFSVPSAWAGMKIFLVYEGVFTDTSTTINGQIIAGLMTNLVVTPATTNTNALPNDRAFDNTASSGQGGTGGIALSSSANVNLGTLNQFTLTAWVKPTADFSTMTTGEFPRIIMVGATSSYDTSVTNGTALLGYNAGGLQLTVNTGSLTVPNGTLTGSDWVFVAATYDSTLSANNVNFYIGNKTNTPALVSSQTLKQGPVAFGTAAYAYLLNRATRDRAFDGWGDDFRIFNSVLNQSALELVCSNGVSTSAPPPPVAQYQWNFDGPITGTTVTPVLGAGGILTFQNSSGVATNLCSAVSLGVSGGTNAAMTNTVVTATAHQGGFYEFKYDVTTNLSVGASTNVLQVSARRWSLNASIVSAEELGDYWDFSGIFRPVYLEAFPAAYIDRVAVNAQASGQITVNAYLGGISNNYTLTAFVTGTNKLPLGSPFSTSVSAGSNTAFLSASLPVPNPWSAEFPTLYTLTVQLLDTNKTVVHTITNLIGFRTITFVNNEGYYINGKKIVLRGICHHEEWPTTGRTSSLGQSDLDLALIKDMNFNTARMTHYPPNKTFLNECDRLGLYVFDELTGWQAAYDNAVASNLVQEMVIRDVNHPCIIAWDNGNEGGWNTTVDNNGVGSTNVYAIWDPQNRHVNRPSSSFNNVVDNHYPSYSGFTGNLGAARTAYSCTEVLHGLYDGGAGASLEDFWDAMRTAPNGIGMFEWVFADGGQARADEGGTMDVKGQSAPDGVMGPYREKEASYYSYKSVYNPVQIGAPNPAAFSGALTVSNRFDFTDLNQCTFDWQLGYFADAADPAADFSTNALTGGLLVSLDSGSFTVSSIPAQTTGLISLPSFPGGWTNYDALRLTATDPFGNNIYTWTWPLVALSQIANRIIGALPSNSPIISAGVNSSDIMVTNGPRVFYFNKTSGILDSVAVSNQPVSFNGGPQPVSGSAWIVNSITNYSDGTNYIVIVNDITNAANGFQWTLRPDGWLNLNYRYTLTGQQNWMGITFNYPTNQVRSMNWLGQGPYRVYKNRSAGQEVFAHTKTYNYCWTGQSTNYAASAPNGSTPTTSQWTYPEFEGYHGQLYWATLQTTEQPITVTTPATNLFFRLLTPPNTDNDNVNVLYPPGAISFLHGINPMGEKFNLPPNLGPAAALNMATGLYTGAINFFFGGIPPLPATPAGLSASAGARQVILSWSGVSGATGYNLKSSTVSGGPYTVIASNLTSLTFTNAGLLNGTTHYYIVTALNGNGEGKSSPEVNATTLVLPPVISSISNSGSNLIFNGTNGAPGMPYLVLMTTNLSVPITDWKVVATNSFNSGGGFNFTNPISPSTPGQFYMLKVQ